MGIYYYTRGEYFKYSGFKPPEFYVIMKSKWISLLCASLVHSFTPHMPRGWHQTTTLRSPSEIMASEQKETSSQVSLSTKVKTGSKKTTTKLKKVAKKSKNNRNVGKNKAPWEHAWVMDGERRKEIISLIEKMERSLLRSYDRTTKDWNKSKQFLEDGMEILVQWAQIGEGNRSEAFAKEMFSHCDDWMKNWLDYYDLQVKVRRRVLHAYYNQLQHHTWNPQTQKPKFQLTPAEVTKGQHILDEANQILQDMERFSREYVIKAREQNKNMLPLLDASDYESLIFGYNQVGGRAVPALDALQRFKNLFHSNAIERLAPSSSVYLAVSKAIFNYKDEQDWIDRIGKSQVEVIDSLCKEYVDSSRKFPKVLHPNIHLYNIALDGWSKVLPPISKDPASSSEVFENEMNEKINQVEEKVSLLWRMLNEDSLAPTSKTLSSLVYAFSKVGKVNDAFILAERWVNTLLENFDAKEKIDGRAFRMLITALARKNNDDSVDASKLRNAESIEKILDYLWLLDEKGYPDISPDIFLYTTAADAWANARCNQSSLRAQFLLDDLKSRYESHGTKRNLKPDIGIYNAVIKAISLQPGLVGAAEKAGAIVKELEANSSIQPDIQTYNGLLQSCLASSEDIYKAEQTLEEMIFRGKPAPNERSYSIIIHALLETPGGSSRAESILTSMEQKFLPRASLYEKVISSWCNEPGMATRALQLLLRFEDIFATNQSNESMRPSRSLYNNVIQALEDQGENVSAQAVKLRRDKMYGDAIIYQKLRSNNQVFAILQEINSKFNGLKNIPSGNKRNFNKVLVQIANSGKIWSGLRAEDILSYMLELSFKRKNKDSEPDIITFNTVVLAWANSGHTQAGEKASEVLKRLDTLHDMGLLNNVMANRITYNSIMNAYAKSSDVPNIGSIAETYFEKLRRTFEETGDTNFKPDIISYATLISAWARSKEVGAAKKAEAILLKMHADYTADSSNPKPNTVCFNEVLYGWARSTDGRASDRAEMVLKLMEDMNRAGNTDVIPDTRTYNIVLLALANNPDLDSPMRAMKFLNNMKRISGSKPDTVSYNTAISAFTKKGSVNAALKILEEVFVQKDIELNSKFFSSLIYSLSQTEAPDAPIVAERIVSDLLERQHSDVTTEICNALIQCWGRSEISDPHRRALRANEILTDMMEGKYSLCATPDVITFSSVIDIWAKSGDSEAPDRAEAVLRQMSGIAKPNVKTYTATIQAHARGQDRDKAKRAQEVLQRMKGDYKNGNLDAEPNIYVYNAVLNAAEFTVGNESELEVAFQVACETFDEVRSSETLKPDHVTYGTFMGVISQLMPKSNIRDDMVQLVFRRCCLDGQLSSMVLKKFKEAADTPQYLTLMGKGKYSESNLPKEWICNVRGARQ
jgi:pentatricopeptide repeat protein